MEDRIERLGFTERIEVPIDCVPGIISGTINQLRFLKQKTDNPHYFKQGGISFFFKGKKMPILLERAKFQKGRVCIVGVDGGEVWYCPKCHAFTSEYCLSFVASNYSCTCRKTKTKLVRLKMKIKSIREQKLMMMSVGDAVKERGFVFRGDIREPVFQRFAERYYKKAPSYIKHTFNSPGWCLAWARLLSLWDPKTWVIEIERKGKGD